MTDTAKLNLPLLAPAQAQKHVTVNEALARVDAAVQLSVLSRELAMPPVTAAEGDAWVVAPASVNDWAGRDGQVAVRQNGGWVFLQPRAGWRAFVADEGETLLHDGAGWAAGAVAVSAGGAAFAFHVREFDHPVAAGATSATAAELPANAVVFGVTARVVADIQGGLASWRLGVAGSDDRYGSGGGTGQGSFLRGITGSPLTYYAHTALLMTAEGGSFAGGGTVRFAVHYARLGLPRLV